MICMYSISFVITCRPPILSIDYTSPHKVVVMYVVVKSTTVGSRQRRHPSWCR